MSEIKACPYCDSTNLYQRQGQSKGDSCRLDNNQYRCNDCRQSFDNPDTRERKHNGGPSADAVLKWAVEGQ